MKKMHKILAVAVIIAIVAAAVGVELYLLTQRPEDITAPGSHALEEKFGGIDRTYIVHIPPSYDGRTSMPLVIMLHGYTESATQAQIYVGTAKSDEEGFIVVYPEGTPQYTRKWNAGFTIWKSDIDDVGFIRELIDRLEQKLKIDPNRIYVAGLSNGALMAYRLAAELSDRIAAIAPVAGSIGGMTSQGLERIPEPSQPVSVIVFHGTADDTVPYYGGIGYGPADYLSVAESVAFWVRCDGCSENPQNETSSDGKVIKSVYTGGTNGTEVVLYTLVDGTHIWPTIATDIIWDFFESHPKQ